MRGIRHFIAGIIMLTPLSTAASAAVECKAELPAARTGHWSWRNIDGKRCWYLGDARMEKTNLEWPRSAAPPAPIESASDNALRKTYSPKVEYLPFEQRWPH
jgi:hypothetical protein